MKETSIEKEAKIVQSEYQKHLSNDAHRLMNLEIHLSKPDHAYNEFYVGTMYRSERNKVTELQILIYMYIAGQQVVKILCTRSQNRRA